tara:strand:- start:8415 stop:8693 length:279 start_codon:yes stop_codon:yes gene_type:complete
MKKSSVTKKDIIQLINNKIGISKLYTGKVLEDFLLILKELIKNENITVQNFGSFKIIHKKERLGRNPKTKINYKISARKSLSFIMSKNLSIK